MTTKHRKICYERGLNLLEAVEGGVITGTVKESSVHLLLALMPIVSLNHPVCPPICEELWGVHKEDGECCGTQSPELSGEKVVVFLSRSASTNRNRPSSLTNSDPKSNNYSDPKENHICIQCHELFRIDE